MAADFLLLKPDLSLDTIFKFGLLLLRIDTFIVIHGIINQFFRFVFQMVPLLDHIGHHTLLKERLDLNSFICDCWLPVALLEKDRQSLLFSTRRSSLFVNLTCFSSSSSFGLSSLHIFGFLLNSTNISLYETRFRLFQKWLIMKRCWGIMERGRCGKEHILGSRFVIRRIWEILEKIQGWNMQRFSIYGIDVYAWRIWFYCSLFYSLGYHFVFIFDRDRIPLIGNLRIASSDYCVRFPGILIHFQLLIFRPYSAQALSGWNLCWNLPFWALPAKTNWWLHGQEFLIFPVHRFWRNFTIRFQLHHVSCFTFEIRRSHILHWLLVCDQLRQKVLVLWR